MATSLAAPDEPSPEATSQDLRQVGQICQDTIPPLEQGLALCHVAHFFHRIR